jgi:hypothetical protein
MALHPPCLAPRSASGCGARATLRSASRRRRKQRLRQRLCLRCKRCQAARAAAAGAAVVAPAALQCGAAARRAVGAAARRARRQALQRRRQVAAKRITPLKKHRRRTGTPRGAAQNRMRAPATSWLTHAPCPARRSAKGGSLPRSDAPAAAQPSSALNETLPLPPSPSLSQEGYTSGDASGDSDAAPLPAASSTMGLAQAKAFPDHDGTFSLFSSAPAEWSLRASLPAVAPESAPLPPYVPWGAAAPAGEAAAVAGGSGWGWSPALWMPRASGSGSGSREDACGAPSEAPPPPFAPPVSSGLWDPPPRSSSSSNAAARVASASAYATFLPQPQPFSPLPPPPPPPYTPPHTPPRRAIAGVDVEAARAAARAALAPRPPQPAATAVIGGGIRRVSASSVLPLGALSLAGRATPPLPAASLSRADDDGDIDAILRGISAAE